MSKKEIAVVPPPKKELVLEGDPEQQLQFAMKAANALMQAVNHKPKKVMIRGEQYLEYGDWQTLARFFGATASVAWSRKLVDDKNVFLGYEARAEVLHNGQVISAAEAMCMKSESNWRSRDEFMLRSMAQTRASAKALRNAYGWVAELAGMKSTPAEEMGEVYDTSPVDDKAVPTVTYDNPEPKDPAPWKKKSPAELAGKSRIKELKKTIKETADKARTGLKQFTEKKEYEDWIFDMTGMDLSVQTEENLQNIISELNKVLKHEKSTS